MYSVLAVFIVEEGTRVEQGKGIFFLKVQEGNIEKGNKIKIIKNYIWHNKLQDVTNLPLATVEYRAAYFICNLSIGQPADMVGLVLIVNNKLCST